MPEELSLSFMFTPWHTFFSPQLSDAGRVGEAEAWMISNFGWWTSKCTTQINRIRFASIFHGIRIPFLLHQFVSYSAQKCVDARNRKPLKTHRQHSYSVNDDRCIMRWFIWWAKTSARARACSKSRTSVIDRGAEGERESIRNVDPFIF